MNFWGPLKSDAHRLRYVAANLLIQLGVVDILPKLFSQVVIPPPVAEELKHPKAPPLVKAFMTSPPTWLDVRTPKTLLTLPHLDPGETAAISLAVELKATLMVEERDGRQAAIAHGLKIIGAIGVLERAAGDGTIRDLRQVYATIRSMRFHVSDAVLAESLSRHLAAKRQ